MAVLHVNVDHVATIREARKTKEPDPVFAALLAEQAGAAGITIHLREDRRHIQDRDVRRTREAIQTRMNLEMASIDEMVEIALETRPDIVTLVPEKRTEVTTEGGLNCLTGQKELKTRVGRLRDAGILVSLFIDPDESQIDAAKAVDADEIELHTGEYANAKAAKPAAQCLERLQKAAVYGAGLGLHVNAGHGLTYFNVIPVARIPEIEELNIGHSVISRSTYVGITQAVREMVALLDGRVGRRNHFSSLSRNRT